MHDPGACIRVENGQKETDHRYVKYLGGAEHISRRELGVGPTISIVPPYSEKKTVNERELCSILQP